MFSLPMGFADHKIDFDVGGHDETHVIGHLPVRVR